MALWARRPPSRRQLVLVGAVLAIALGIVGLEALGLWPEALTTHRLRP